MRLSILQPAIVRGDIRYNMTQIQKLINNAAGDILVLGEYALTGSLVLDETADAVRWADACAKAAAEFQIPAGKRLLFNGLFHTHEGLRNACVWLPGGDIAQVKVGPDAPELDAGIAGGGAIFPIDFGARRAPIVICSDLREPQDIDTTDADFILFIFHFTPQNRSEVMARIQALSKERGLPVVTASLVSDRNCGHSCYVFGNTVVALGAHEGILELKL